MKKKYSLHVKLAFALGQEHEMLTSKQIKDIPYATRNYWRNQPPDKYLTGNLRSEILDRTIVLGPSFKYKRLLCAFRMLNKELINQIGQTEYHRLLDSIKTEFVRTIELLSTIALKKNLLEEFAVHKSQYSVWKSQVSFHCSSSAQNLCARKHSQQLTRHEIEKMKELIELPKFYNWPLNAIWANGLRSAELVLSRSTFYRYNKIFGFRKKRRRKWRQQYSPLRAKDINQIWHADLTYVKTLDGMWSYIYAIIDNYSKKVLSFKISRRITATEALSCLQTALAEQRISSINYVTDGGPEYNNSSLRGFIEQCPVIIKHSIAKKDIKQSNSMIERLFHLIKKDYINQVQVRNHKDLVSLMSDVFNEYNNRPHYRHKIYTPSEVHDNDLNFDASRLLRSANVARLEANRNCTCSACFCT